MGLREYWKKRDFEETPEPRGVERAEPGNRFIVQKHAASRLHYDFRLELDGVLLSWAIPKGPSLDPADKRLAVHTEDHPIEYADFEGVIPKGQYGGGTVLLWDRGRWFPQEDPHEGMRKGKLRFRLEGEKLHGGWKLVRTRGKDEKDEWLLIKEKDEVATDDGELLVRERAESVATGRAMAEIAQDKDRLWDSKVGEVAPPRPALELPGEPAPRPARLEPALCTLVPAAPDGDDWLHEIKLDGYRLTAWLRDGKARLLTRAGHDWTPKFAPVARALEALPVKDAILDGEVVALDRRGISDFSALQRMLGDKPGDAGDARMVYFLFDLPWAEGKDLRPLPLLQRKDALRRVLADARDTLRYTDHVSGQGPAFFARACGLGLEGSIAKRADSPYRSGRGRDWLKIKCGNREEFVVVGWTDPEGARSRFGSLLLAVPDEAGLRFAGRVGTGFTQATLDTIHARLRPRATPPVFDPPKGAEARGVHWAEPDLSAEVTYTEWTRDGRLRHPSFKRLTEPGVDRAGAAEPLIERSIKTEPIERSVKKEPIERSVKKAPTARAEKKEEPPPPGDRVAGVKLSNPHRVLWEGMGVTKLELARYYERVADRMLPHFRERPLTLLRCPNGASRPCFYQRHRKETQPASVYGVVVAGHGEGEAYVWIDSLEGLVALVQMGSLEIHPWGSKVDHPELPDTLIFDLDPDPELGWERLAEAALLVRERLSALGLGSFVKVTGGKGLHVVVPIDRTVSWAVAKEFTRRVAEAVVREHPDRYTAKMSKALRRGKIFIDWLRNAETATAVGPWSTRARPGAPVAAPLAWEEVLAVGRGNPWNVRDVLERLEAPDPWAGYADVRQAIGPSVRAALGME